ncbi:hypothetical protein V8F33_002982 [Rhypophila sp. PSN 637]
MHSAIQVGLGLGVLGLAVLGLAMLCLAVLPCILRRLPGKARTEVALASRKKVALADKEVLFQDADYWAFGRDMVARLPSTRFRITRWVHGYVPRACVTELESRGGSYSAKDLWVFNVNYTDCDTPWVFCNHRLSGMSDSHMAEQFGRLPVKMRSHVRHVMGLPRGLNDPGCAYCEPLEGDIVFLGVPNIPGTFFTWVHEVAHSIDAITIWRDREFSATEEWSTAVDKDSAVPTNYARTKQVENFAENFVVALHVRIGGVIPGDKWNKIKWQQRAIVDKYGDVFDPKGTCSSRKRPICDEIICLYPDSSLYNKGSRRGTSIVRYRPRGPPHK